MLGTANGPRPIRSVRVVLHRVGADRAGPLDSVFTDARGGYAFRYRPSGNADAIYFVSASYRGIAYFTAPLRGVNVRGDDAAITVFDTSSGPVPIHVIGRHFVLGVPDGSGRREIVEVYELGNDSSVTLVSGGRDRPVWIGHLPGGAENPRINPSGEIPASAVTFSRERVELRAPLSPGAHQLSFAYDLRRDGLPLAVPIEAPAGVIEVLVEEPRATVSGARLSEVAPVTTAGRTFRRFLAQSVPADSVVRVDVPFAVGEVRGRYVASVAATCGVAMLTALLVAARRRKHATSPVRASDQLIREIAILDARFERHPSPSPDERRAYETERSALKSRIAAALAEEGPRA